ncbi:hypothetical protein CVT25_011639 [Psilocybe cyanescens]|uniref:NodB homology domain-containing protein n=1 Tax=Psilocybe cyanescens TaxID=93625 RepID=A0A409WIK6_PSICY|nr:hypothetical protein CVT25_011639 [Psilocybe cyanescens]
MISLTVFTTLCLAFWGTSAAPTNSTLERRAATVYTRCTVPNTVALTFDDGPYSYTYDIVNALDNAGAKGTFFVSECSHSFLHRHTTFFADTRSNSKTETTVRHFAPLGLVCSSTHGVVCVDGCIYDQANAARVKYAYDHGHMIGSHTWAHKDLTTLTWDQIHDEMWRVEQALVKITGAYPAFMRPPYGNYNGQVLDASGIRGQGVVIWDFDSEDSLGASVQTSKNLYDSTIGSHPSTILALNHETIETTAHQVLPYAIQKLKAAGYRLVTISECLGKPAYQSVVAPAARDSTWHC